MEITLEPDKKSVMITLKSDIPQADEDSVEITAKQDEKSLNVTQ